MDPISISEFRKSTKVILDSAKYDPVYIRRGDDLFQLSYHGDVFSKGTPRKEAPTPLVGDGLKNVGITWEGVIVPLNQEKESQYSSPPEKNRLAAPRDKAILAEIKSLEEELKDADFTNQDPDYWDAMNAKKTKINALWTEWHEVTGR